MTYAAVNVDGTKVIPGLRLSTQVKNCSIATFRQLKKAGALPEKFVPDKDYALYAIVQYDNHAQVIKFMGELRAIKLEDDRRINRLKVLREFKKVELIPEMEMIAQAINNPLWKDIGASIIRDAKIMLHG